MRFPIAVALAVAFAAGPVWAARPLTFEERVGAQEAIERFYYKRRLWPAENPAPKPPFEQVVSRPAIEAHVLDYLKRGEALASLRGTDLSARELQEELDRMARGSRDPDGLRALFGALGNDPERLAECLARPLLADRVLRGLWRSTVCEADPVALSNPLSFEDWWDGQRDRYPGTEPDSFPVGVEAFRLPRVAPSTAPCTPWDSITAVPDPRAHHTAVWTGSEMLVWGGGNYEATGYRYSPSTDTWLPMSLGAGAPEGAAYHQAVWTGTEMIVWGGMHSGLTHTRAGARYNPATDSWHGTSLDTGCPSARYGHTVLWTGSEMVVWGGRSVTGILNTGGRYNPETDTWTATSTADNCPVARFSHSAVWTGSLMLVWGGSNQYSQAVHGGASYSPTSDTWATLPETAETPLPRYLHTAVWTGSLMLVWGGKDNYNNFPDGASYSPSSGVWTTLPYAGTPQGRACHTAVWTGEKMIVWGGQTSTVNALDTGGIYDPELQSWTPIPSQATSPLPRSYHSAVWTGRQMIVWGGFSPGRGNLPSGARFDVVNGTWEPTWLPGDKPSARCLNSLTWTGAELVVWGGTIGDSDKSDGARYDPITDTWKPMPGGTGAPCKRREHTAVWTGLQLIVWGGFYWVNGNLYQLLNDGSRYDPQLNTWAPTSTASGVPDPRAYHSAFWTGARMLVWGGYMSNTGGLYDPVADTWSPTSTGAGCPGGRVGATEVWTGSEMITWGGYWYDSQISGNRYENTGARYSPSTNAWTATGVGTHCPDGRYAQTAGWTGSEMVIWGGRSIYDAGLTSGARYRPSTGAWTSMTAGAATPSPRVGAVALWTGSEFLIWGGSDTETDVRLNTGAYYSPATDTWRATPLGLHCPTPRMVAGAWTGDRMAVWGGLGDDSTFGTGALLSPSGPPPLGLPSPAVTDQTPCAAGVRVAWQTDPEDWNDGGASALRGYTVYRDGAPLAGGGCSGTLPYGTTSCTDGTTAGGGTFVYRLQYKNGCDGAALSSGTSATDAVATPPTISGPNVNTCPAASAALTSTAALAYQWNYEGSPIAGANAQTYAATLTGSYTVTARDAGGCTTTSAPKTVTAIFCPQSEVSPPGGVFPLTVTRFSGGATTLRFQKITNAVGYSVYWGPVGNFYSHGGAGGRACDVPVTDLGTGELSTPLPAGVPSGNLYFLVTAHSERREGPSGFDSAGVEIPATMSLCSP